MCLPQPLSEDLMLLSSTTMNASFKTSSNLLVTSHLNIHPTWSILKSTNRIVKQIARKASFTFYGQYIYIHCASVYISTRKASFTFYGQYIYTHCPSAYISTNWPYLLLLSPEIEASSVEWAQLSMYYLKTETESSVRNVVI
jgi:hypothetical protein